MLLQRDSGLLAVICDDLVVRIVDIETRRTVRELKGFRGRILDVVCDYLFDSKSDLDLVNRVDFFSGLPLASRCIPRHRYPHV